VAEGGEPSTRFAILNKLSKAQVENLSSVLGLKFPSSKTKKDTAADYVTLITSSIGA